MYPSPHYWNVTDSYCLQIRRRTFARLVGESVSQGQSNYRSRRSDCVCRLCYRLEDSSDDSKGVPAQDSSHYRSSTSNYHQLRSCPRHVGWTGGGVRYATQSVSCEWCIPRQSQSRSFVEQRLISFLKVDVCYFGSDGGGY